MTANTSNLIVHSLQGDQLGDGLLGDFGSDSLRRLSSRALLLSQPNDMVIVDSEPDQGWLSFLKTCGIEPGHFQVAHGVGETLADRIRTDLTLLERLSKDPWTIQPYMGGSTIDSIAEAIDAKVHAPCSNLIARINLKSNLNQILREATLPVIPTSVASEADLFEIVTTMLNTNGPVLVRSDLSIGGHGVWKVEQKSGMSALQHGVKRSAKCRLFIVQPLLKVKSSPNIQFDIADHGPECLGMSSQQMTQSYAFGGNDHPSPDATDLRVTQQSQRVAEWLFDSGYRGIVGVDFIITQDDKVFIVEINPRVNTSTFPLMVSKRLGRSAFKLVTGIKINGVESFDQLRECLNEDILYDQNKGTGMIPLVLPTPNRPALDAMIFSDELLTANKINELLHRKVCCGGRK